MKKLTYLLLPLLAVCLMGCSKKKRMATAEIPEEPDSTIYAQLKAVTDDSITIYQLDSKSTRKLGYIDAQHANAVHGSLTVGDTLAVMPLFKSAKARSVVNMSELVGLWMFDGNNGTGLRLSSDGAASDVGPSDVTFRGWKIRNGRFILTYIKADGSDYTEMADTSTIISLSKDEFRYTLKGQEHNCTRVKKLLTR